MKRALVLLVVLVSLVLGLVGSASAAHGDIDPFSVRSSKFRG